MNSQKIAAVIVALVVVGAAAFYGGMQYGKSQSTSTSTFAGRTGAGFGGGNRQFGGTNGDTGARTGARPGGGNFTAGDILSMDNMSITVKMQDGSSRIVFYNASTTIGKSTTGTAADLTTGARVVVNGTSNSDGSLTAENIEIGSMSFGRGGGPGGAPAAAPAQ